MAWLPDQKKFNVGDTAYIWVGNHHGKLTEGKVIAIITLPGYLFSHYVVEIDTSIDPLLEIRTGIIDMHYNDFTRESETEPDVCHT